MITNDNITSKEPIPPLLKLRDVAKVLSLSRTSVRGLIDSGELAASPLHGPKKKAKRTHVRITRVSLLNFYQKRFGHPLARALQNPFQS